MAGSSPGRSGVDRWTARGPSLVTGGADRRRRSSGWSLVRQISRDDDLACHSERSEESHPACLTEIPRLAALARNDRRRAALARNDEGGCRAGPLAILAILAPRRSPLFP